MAITLARRIGELCVLMSGPPYTVFIQDKIYLHPHPKFLTKVVSYCHINQTIYLPSFFQKSNAHKDEKKLHTLDVSKASAFYLDRTKPFRSSMVVAGRMKILLKGTHHDSLLYTLV